MHAQIIIKIIFGRFFLFFTGLKTLNNLLEYCKTGALMNSETVYHQTKSVTFDRRKGNKDFL